jgi:hypothetical protein
MKRFAIGSLIILTGAFIVLYGTMIAISDIALVEKTISTGAKFSTTVETWILSPWIDPFWKPLVLMGSGILIAIMAIPILPWKKPPMPTIYLGRNFDSNR